MSLPSFPSPPKHTVIVSEPGPGAGDHLPVWLLALCGTFTAVATAVSVMSIALQLKNYRKPPLQRAVVRIMVMVPLYAISSLIALFSLEAAFFIDAVRDLYEAFVIYTFLQLLITYLGGERSLLITLHGRPPIPHPFPVNLFLQPMDPSDPWTLLALKRGVLQYVQIKPLLVLATVVLKATGTYREGKFAADSGYTYISIVYNVSICLSLYCLAMFWVAVNNDLKPFRPVPKFLCVKGILFFSFWQSVGISLLVAIKAIRKVGPYTDAEHMSLALVDSLICFEMPIFAIAHQYAFQASDYIDHSLIYTARLPFIYALRDAFGLKDVWEDTKDTFKGRGVSYQAYEPAEGGLHYGLGRQRRIRAGLRYAKGGKAKYWLPMPGDPARGRGETGPLTSIKRRMDRRVAEREGYAPLLPHQAARVVHSDAGRGKDGNGYGAAGDDDSSSDESDAPSLEFSDVADDEEVMYERARRIGYAGFPNVDVSKEAARRQRWEDDERRMAGTFGRPAMGERARSGSSTNVRAARAAKVKGKSKMGVYGAWAESITSAADGPSAGSALPPADGPPMPTLPGSPFALGDDDADDDADADAETDPDPDAPVRPASRPLPADAVDLVVEDNAAVERARERERRKGEPQTNAPVRVFRHLAPNGDPEAEAVEVSSPGAGAGEGGDANAPVADIDDVERERAKETREEVEEVLAHDRAVVMTPPHFGDDNPWA